MDLDSFACLLLLGFVMCGTVLLVELIDRSRTLLKEDDMPWQGRRAHQATRRHG